MITKQHFCVPTALSILTSKPIQEVEADISKIYLGDIPIGGIYIGLALKYLSDNGYQWIADAKEGRQLRDFKWNNSESWLIEISGHALVINKGMVFDSLYPCGVYVASYEYRRRRIVRAYRITKDAS
jgi:hypothetical protein